MEAFWPAGGSYVRGISGGQRKRLTSGEMTVGYVSFLKK